MTRETFEQLGITGFRLTPTVVELGDFSTIHQEGMIEYVIILVDSWEYLVDFLVLQPKTHQGGHSIIMGRQWLATTNAFIGCMSGFMTFFMGIP